jgi:hypothetical protein
MAEAVCAASVRTASNVGLGVMGVADGVDRKICVSLTSAVWAAAVYIRSGLVVGDAVAFALQPIKTMGMITIAKIKIFIFLSIASPQQLGIYSRLPRSFSARQKCSFNKPLGLIK